MIRSRRSRSIGAALLLLVAGVLTQSGGLALADTPTVGALSASFSSGVTPTDFAVTGGASGSANTIATPFTGSCTRYSDNIATAHWITASSASQACGASTNGVNGVTTYTVHFTLPARATNGSITGSYYTDNYGSVLVNDQQVSAQPTGDVPANYGNPIPGTPTAINSSAPIQAGDNTLKFVVTDVGSVTGLDYAATINYDTLAGPVQNLLATPGNTTAVLSWAPPADLGSKPLSSTAPYVITVAGSGSGTGTTQVPPSAVQPCLGNTANVCYNVSGLSNGTDYTFTVQAQTGAGLGDSATATAKPSADSQAAIVAPNVTQTLTTCKYATVAQPVCDVYTVPKGGGGVFGLTGNVPVGGTFCGGAACNGNGAQTILPPVGYTDPKHPIVDTVTFDRSISPRGIFTQVFYQTDTGQPFQLKFCKNPFVANPDPCISTLIVLFNPFNPVVNGDVQVRILLTSSGDPKKAHR